MSKATFRPDARTVVYLAGPMRPAVDLNFALFHKVAHVLRRSGMNVANPAEINSDLPEHDVALRRDYAHLMYHCHAIAMLPGWRASVGASTEHAIALSLGYPVYYLALSDTDDVAISIFTEDFSAVPA